MSTITKQHWSHACGALKRRALRRRTQYIALALISILAFHDLVHPELALAESQFRYDPAQCKTDSKDRLYIALGRTVIAVPVGGDTMIDLVRPNDHIPPPDPEEKPGCLDNPAQMYSYSFLYQMQAIKEEKSGSVPASRPTPDLLQLIAQKAPSPGDKFEVEFAEQEAGSRCTSSSAAIIGGRSSLPMTITGDIGNGFAPRRRNTDWRSTPMC